MPVVTTSSRGQIVIPRDIRKQLQIVPGKKLVVKVEGEHAVITSLPDDPVESFYGFFEGGGSLTKALLDERRKDGGSHGPFDWNHQQWAKASYLPSSDLRHHT